MGWGGTCGCDVELLPVSSMVMAITLVRSSSTSPAASACLVCSPGSTMLTFTSLSSPGGCSQWLVEPYCGMVVRRWTFVVDSVQTICAEGGGLGFRAPGC